MTHIAPSFLSADIWRVAEQLTALEQAGCKYLHLDVMDGCFVPNISFGAGIIGKLRKHSQMVFDTHLMVEEPDRFIEDFAKAGCDHLYIHVEASRHPHRSLQRIKQAGMKAGLVLNPATPLCMAEELLHDADLMLLMSVNPGFGGQSFITSVADKVARLAKMREDAGAKLLIEVDGGVCRDNVKMLKEKGADLLVAGNAVFGAPDPAAAFIELTELMK
ncbi:MAG: ribulose-phosphate 3-epimerase [Firmicutes bacterium]|nr:ribulose-phosphate 3-epimerase [Bacillota bacterium]